MYQEMGKKKAIILGSNGQDGYFMSRLLKREGIESLSISRSGDGIIGDVSNANLVENIIKEYIPDFIFHFAANSTTEHEALLENHKSIFTGALNVLEAVRMYSPFTKVFLAGSAIQFRNDGLPINEDTPFEASNQYSLARISSVYAARYYRFRFNLSVYVGYLFHHDSPLRSERHINQRIVKTVQRIQAGSHEKLEIGNIEVIKEFNYAKDIVEAIWTLVNQDKFFEVVIGSGIGHSIRDWLDYCFRKVGKLWQDHTIIRTDYVPEYMYLVSNPKRIKDMGWENKVNIFELADIMIANNLFK